MERMSLRCRIQRIGSMLGRRRLQPLGWLLLFLLLFTGYLYANQFHVNTSDNASMILEGQAMLHGNLFMHGWYLPPDSFITTEMPLDALASVFFSGVALLKITPALLYAATVVAASYLASRRIADPRGRWLAVAACVALIAFPIGALFGMVTQGPMHVGTLVASLIAWLTYDYYVRHPAFWGALVLFVLVTALAIVGDAMAELLIVAPVGIVSAWALWRNRGRDRVASATLAGALVALLLGTVLEDVLVSSGTFINGSAPIRLASPTLIWTHIQWLFVGVSLLFHIDVQQKLGFEQVLFLAAERRISGPWMSRIRRSLSSHLVPKGHEAEPYQLAQLGHRVQHSRVPAYHSCHWYRTASLSPARVRLRGHSLLRRLCSGCPSHPPDDGDPGLSSRQRVVRWRVSGAISTHSPSAAAADRFPEEPPPYLWLRLVLDSEHHDSGE